MTENELLDANFTLLKRVMTLEEENDWLCGQLEALIKKISALEDQIETMVQYDTRTIGLGPPQ